MRTKIKAIVTAGVLMALGPIAAHATLIGDTVDVSFFSDYFGPIGETVVVGPGQETSFYGGNYLIDIGENYVQITMGNGPFCGFTCTDDPATLLITGMDFSPAAVITAVSLVDGGMAPFNASFTDDSVSFQMLDIPQDVEMFARLEFEVSSIPEPTSMALLGLGLVGMRLRRRMKA